MEDCKKNTVFTPQDLPIISKRKEEPKLTNTLVSKEDEIVTTAEKVPFIIHFISKINNADYQNVRLFYIKFD